MTRGALRIPARCVMTMLDAVAEQWLGHALPPAERAIERSDWAPDARDAYCPRCGDSVGPGEGSDSGCGTCRDRPAIADGVVRLGPHSGDLREWILALKFERRWIEMGHHLGARLGEAVLDSRRIDPQRAVVVPMPMPWQRRMYRGIDHARVIAWAVGRRLRAPMIDVLAKSNGPPQIELAPSVRARSGSRGLRIRRRLGGWHLDGLHIVLVDDVRTTGASLKAAARLLRKLRPERIIAAALAVSDDAARRDRAAQRRPEGHAGPGDDESRTEAGPG
jgi:predicted amidophosphoribosyltransferase